MIRLVDITVRFGERVLLDAVTLQLDVRDRIGLVGDNGAGKSTLLRIIAGEEELDGGAVERARFVSVGYLPQEGLTHRSASLYAEVETAFEDVLAVQRRRDEASDQLADVDDSPARRNELLEIVGELEHRLEDFEAHKLKSKIERVLFGLGFSDADLTRPCEEFSGGWQMRIALAKLLLREPSILLMDEPTNHLDLDSLRWLEDYLQAYDGALMLVSHDRAFLDAMCVRTFHVTHGRVDVYRGNYSAFEIEREQRREQMLRTAENQRRERAHLQAFVDRFRAKASKATQAQSRVKRLAKMEVLSVDGEDDTIGFSFPPPVRSGQVVARLTGIDKSYGALHVLSGVELEIQRGDRVAVVGVNGAGKSTLARVLAGTESLDAGERKIGYNVQLAFFAQNQADELDPDATPLDVVTASAHPELRARVRSTLGAFLFRGDDVFKNVRVLSGGEKNRLALARMLVRPANFLVFDEPTNHLDMRSKAVLQAALGAFAGTFLIVSHDRAFLDPLVNRVIEVRSDGIRSFPGNVSDYIERVSRDRDGGRGCSDESSAPNDAGAGENPRERRRRDAERRRQVSNWKKRADALEGRIATLETNIGAREAAMATSEFFQRGDVTTREMKEYDDWKQELVHALREWESVMSRMQATSQSDPGHDLSGQGDS